MIGCHFVMQQRVVVEWLCTSDAATRHSLCTLHKYLYDFRVTLGRLLL
jgi:hypothetical protein